MEPLEKAALAVAALAHDVGHPGRTNQFFVACFDPLVSIIRCILLKFAQQFLDIGKNWPTSLRCFGTLEVTRAWNCRLLEFVPPQ